MKKKKRRTDLTPKDFDLLNIDMLRRFVSGDGKSAKILPRYVHGLNSRAQSELAKTIKRARQLNLL